jgi:hypothetical protein
MGESTNTAARGRLEALVGEWAIEAGPPGGPPWPGGGRVTFEWLDGVPLLIERSHVDVPEAPDGVVQRVYEMSLGDGVWKLWRDGEPFSQRFTSTFSVDGKTIATSCATIIAAVKRRRAASSPS